MDSLAAERVAERGAGPLLRVAQRPSAALAIEMRIDKDYRDLVTRTIAAADERAKTADVARPRDAAAATCWRPTTSSDANVPRRRPRCSRRSTARLDCGAAPAAGARRLGDRVRSALPSTSAGSASAVQRFSPVDRQPRADSRACGTVAGRAAAAGDTAERDRWRDLKSRRLRPPRRKPAHSMLVSAVQMAIRAATSRRLAITAADMNTAWEASSAAAGALMLFERAQEELRKLTTATRIVITPRTTRLLRVPDLQAMHRAIARVRDPPCGARPSSCRPPRQAPRSGGRSSILKTGASADDPHARRALRAAARAAMPGGATDAVRVRARSAADQSGRSGRGRRRSAAVQVAARPRRRDPRVLRRAAAARSDGRGLRSADDRQPAAEHRRSIAARSGCSADAVPGGGISASSSALVDARAAA